MNSNENVILPNSILTFSLVYLIMVISDISFTIESDFRKIFYYTLLTFNIVALLYINTDYFLFKNIHSSLVQYLKEIFNKQKRKESLDEIKNFVEKSVAEDFRSQEKIIDNFNYVNVNPEKQIFHHREKELLTSKTKIDDRLFSNKFPLTSTSPSKFNFLENKRDIHNIQYSGRYSSHIGGHPRYTPLIISRNEFTPNIQDYSYYLLKSFQLSQKFYQKLKIGSDVNREEIENDAERLKISNSIDNWITNLKYFLISYLIPNVIIYNHCENIDHLNKNLENFLNVQLVLTLVDESEHLNFGEDVKNMINLNFQGKNTDLYATDLFKERKAIKINKIFFGDNQKLQFILDNIEFKINHALFIKSKSKEVEDFSNKNLSKTLFSRFGGEDNKHSLNPIFGKSKMIHETEVMENREANILENLKNLKELINLRISLNNILSPYFVKEHNDRHKLLLLEYVIWRIKDLENNKFENYKNDSGGNFKDEPWFSAFPTDSQLIASILIKYIENSRESTMTKSFVVNYPIPPVTEKNSGGVILYQKNGPEYEPHFNVFYEENMINCQGGKDNFFYAMSIFLYLIKTKKSYPSKQLSVVLDELTEAVIKNN